MRAFVAKIAGESGETLVETLAAVLISALAAVMLMTAVATSASLNKSADEYMSDLRVQGNAAAGFGATGAAVSSGTVTFTDRGNASTPSYDRAVSVYGGDYIVSYELE